MTYSEFMQLEPCPARGKYTDSLMDSPDWYAEEKYDGDRRIAQFVGGQVRFTGRRISVKDGLYVEKTANIPQLSGQYRPALQGTVLDGEMVVPDGFQTDSGGKSKYVTSIMGSLPAEAIAKQKERGWLVYRVFDILWYKGEDVRAKPYTERRALMLKAVAEWGCLYALPATATNKNKAAFLKGVYDNGGEGIILKHRASIYGEKKRWVKVKGEITLDCVIMGYDAPEKESEKVDGSVSVTKFHANGWIGAIQFGQYKDGKLTQMGTASGMDEATRIKLSGKGGAKYVGQVITIVCNGREPTGACRHPRFKGFRDDKQAADCVYYPEEC